MSAFRSRIAVLMAMASLTVASAQTTTQTPAKPAAVKPAPARKATLPAAPPDLSAIETVVVLFAENRGFDTLYGAFPGANGLRGLPASRAVQHDRDGSVLKTLPPIWTGL